MQLQNGNPFVVYRKPDTDSMRYIGQKDTALHHTTSFTESGFVFAPFDTQKPAVLLIANNILELVHVPLKSANRPLNVLPQQMGTGKDFHLKLVSKGIAGIRSGAFAKVVLSRRMEVPMRESPLDLFKGLLDSYPSAFCYLWYHPKVGLWLGATPELLMKVHSGQFSTMSLAGTKKYVHGESPSWTAKEQKEQALVTEYICEGIKREVKGLAISKLESVRAGNLWHLRTSISGLLEKRTIGKILEVLHPTPAVCGIPREGSKKFIEENEGYDREFYTGFLGELNYPEGVEVQKVASEFFVNLRCMQIKGDRALLYVGGGITGESIPESEWEETVDKSTTLLRILCRDN